MMAAAGGRDESGGTGGARVRVGSLADLEPGHASLVEVDGRRICLARTPEGDVHALDDTCTHEEESLSEGWVVDGCVECPAHNSSFDLVTGEPTMPPAMDPVAVHTVELDGDDVFVTVAD